MTIMRSGEESHCNSTGKDAEVYEADNGNKAQRIADEQPIYLALVDLFLSHDDSLHVAENIHRRHPNTRFIIMTAHGELKRAQVVRRPLKENFLEKSLLDEALVNKIEEVRSSH